MGGVRAAATPRRPRPTTGRRPGPSRAATVLVGAIAALAGGCDGCDGCAGGAAPVRVREPHPHVRCETRPAARDVRLEVGALRVEREGRALRVGGPLASPQLVAFAGPAPSDEPLDAFLAALAPAPIAVVLGGLGDDADTASRNARALAASGRVVVVVPGGRDTVGALDAALDALPGDAPVFDASRLDRLLVGALAELVLLSGAPGGRFARTRDACGHGPEDLRGLRRRLGDPSGPRGLLSWAAPAGAGARAAFPDEGGAAVDAGDPELAAFVEAAGVSFGVHAWPPAAVRLPGVEGPRTWTAVPRGVGPSSRRADGGYVPPGPTYLDLSTAPPAVHAPRAVAAGRPAP